MSITPFPSQGQYPWYDQLKNWGADTQTAAENATIAADQAHADAATAQSTADTAVTNAATAQDRADDAFSNAATAQSTADTAVTNAATAQDRADDAFSNAATAQSTADTAQGDATQALADAATADGKAVDAQIDATQALATADDVTEAVGVDFAWTGTPNASTSTKTTPDEVVTNLAINPSFEVSFDTIEVYRNLALNPSMKNSLSGWTPSAQVTATPTSEGIQIDLPSGLTAGLLIFNPAVAVPVEVGRFYSSAYEVSVPVGSPPITLRSKVRLYGAITDTSYTSIEIQPGSTVTIAPPVTVPATADHTGLRATIEIGKTLTENSRIIVRNAMVVAGAYLPPYFDGDYSPDPDLTPSWTGPVSSSPSVLSGEVPIATGTPASVARGISSTRWRGSGGRSLRLISAYPSRGAAYTELANNNAPRGLVAGKTYTISIDLYMEKVQGFSSVGARTLQLTGTTGAAHNVTVQGADVAGEQRLSMTCTIPPTGPWYLRLYNGGMAGDPDTWWDNLSIVEGEYTGPYFDGDTTVSKSLDSLAVTARTGVARAEQAQATAQGVADNAYPSRVVLGNADLDTVKLAGFYRQNNVNNVTLANHYPVAGFHCMLEVFPFNGAVGSEAGVVQRVTYGGGAGAPKGVYQRLFSASAWSRWFFIPTQRIDNTAGRAIYTWDETQNRETLISYESGWRDISGLLINGWALGSEGLLLLKRTGYMVTLYARNLTGEAATSTTMISQLPTGFMPLANSSAAFTSELGLGLRFYTRVFTLPTSARIGDQNNGAEATWTTTNTVPPTLPGTAVGTIPF